MLVGVVLIESSTSRGTTAEPRDPEEPLYIAAFPDDDAYWRVDWFGEIAYPDRYTRRKHPSILIYLSKLTESNFSADPEVLLQPHCTAPAKGQTRIWVSVGTLMVLRIGDIWHRQKLHLSPEYTRETFKKLWIGRNTTDFIKAGLNPDKAGFLIPIPEHPWHMNATHSYCVMANLPDGRRLIVPCVELIRFYFGSSSSLLRQIFSTQLRRENLYSEDRYDHKSGLLSFKLGYGMSGRSASDIGRLHLDAVAWRAAAMVSVSMLKAKSTGDPAFIQSFFPFEGNTFLDVSGKWLSFQGEPNQTFLVYGINSCTHSFPFKSLKYVTADTRVKPQFTHQQQPNDKSEITGSSRDKKDQPLIEKDPSSTLQGKTKQVHQSERFPDLRGKPVWKERVLSLKEWLVKKARASKGGAVEAGAIGEGGSSSRVRPTELEALCQKNKLPKQPPPEFVRRPLEELLTLGPMDIQLLTASDEDNWTIPVGLMVSEDGVIADQLFIKADESTQRLRRACVIKINDGSHQYAMAILETTPEFIRMYPLAEVNIRVGEILSQAEHEFLRTE
jgi:hypothetical protein